jgi:protein-disulfide isomerase
VRDNYKDQVRIVYKDFPLDNIHPHARKAAEAARCAGEQGKYWEYHDILFANSTALDPTNLKKFAADLKLDTGRFDTCLEGSKYASAVAKDQAEGTQAGVGGTPAFFIDGRPLSGAQPFASFQDLIEEALEAR